MPSIEKGLIIYRGPHYDLGNRSKALKYGLHLRSIRYVHYSSAERKRCMRVVRSQGRKRAAVSDFEYKFEYDQDRLVQDVEKISGMRRFRLDFIIDLAFDFYESERSVDSQFAVYSDGSDNESENELDLEIQSNSSIIQNNKRTLKKIFKQAKRVANFSLIFQKMDQNHARAFHYLPLMTLLEDCYIKIKIRGPNDILALRNLLKQAKQRNYWPNIKSMMISLRYSYNKENCTSKFIRFCRVLQEVFETIQDLPWINIQLKVKYMWRLDESAILSLQGVLEKAQNQLIKLSFVTCQVKQLKPLFKTIEEMKRLNKFSLKFNEATDLASLNSFEELTELLKKIPSLRRLRVQGKNILDQGETQKATAERSIKSLGDFSQITSFSFREKNQFIDKTLWSCFSNSVLNLPQLQVLVLKTEAFKVGEMSPGLVGFLEFFEGLKNLQNLRIFHFDMYYPNYASKIDGSEIFLTFCEALQNLKELRKLHFNYPWLPNMNSDIQELIKAIPNLQKLERFYFNFAVLKFIEPVENDVFLEFCKVICCLKVIEYFSINLELEEINHLTYEAVLFPFRHLKPNNPFWRLSLGSMQVDDYVKRRLAELTRQIYIWTKK